MTQADPSGDFHLRVRGAQLHLELDRRRGEPSPAWVHALVEEGERHALHETDPGGP